MNKLQVLHHEGAENAQTNSALRISFWQKTSEHKNSHVYQEYTLQLYITTPFGRHRPQGAGSSNDIHRKR
jgi:hypothetical protein